MKKSNTRKKKKGRLRRDSFDNWVIVAPASKWDIANIFITIYLVPLAKIIMFLYLIISRRILSGIILFIIFGLDEFFHHRKTDNTFDFHWLVIAISCVFLWPVMYIFSFIPPKD